MKLDRLCKFAEKNSKFVVFLGAFIAIAGTGFSIDKSISIYNLNMELQDSNHKVKLLQDKIDNLNTRIKTLTSDYNRSSKQWNGEKRELLEGIINSKNESK